MVKIPFSVSARTARLIGQENFTNAEGAIIELVKNSYDADAKLCLVVFDIPFVSLQNPLLDWQTDVIRQYDADFFDSLVFDPGTFHLTPESLKQNYKKIRQILHARNSIYIIDCGDGMNQEIIENNWMRIGTGNKEEDYLSIDGRVKTGAKGIGRFALDRLGALSEMWTVYKDSTHGYHWKMDWQQFERPNSSLSDIQAELEESNISIADFLTQNFSSLAFFEEVPLSDFKKGTIIKISRLRDNWDLVLLNNSYKNLEALIPPKEFKIPFKVFQGYLQEPDIYGEVDTAYFDDYDYKVYAKYDSDKLEVALEITRHELDVNVVEKNFKLLYENVESPYDLITLNNKDFSYKKDVNEIMKWPKTENNQEFLKQIGDFSFTFYFLKNTVSSKENYPYLPINRKERQAIITRFGGIKIYRDSFRVRPYGDPENDWLKLGERAQRSPAGAGQRIGDWRVGPNQVAGIISISRIDNPSLVDKSDRGSLVENIYFDLFKKIITGIINEFEYDRSRILNPYYLYFEAEKERIRQEEIQKAAKEIADKLFQKRLEEEQTEKNTGFSDELNGEEGNETSNDEEKEAFQKMLEETLSTFQNNDDEDKDADVAQVRSLASLGLIVASFAHELREIRNNVDEIKDLEEIYNKIISSEIKNAQDYIDGTNIIELLKSGGDKIKHWVDYSLTAIKKDKRKRTSLDFDEYFTTLKANWQIPLNDRDIELKLENRIFQDYSFRAFEVDMDTIFGNLIANSIDSFNNVNKIIDREINVVYSVQNEQIIINYKDNGAGLPEVFSNKEDIFLPFTTSKKDTKGNDIGTGLGMYLVKMVVQDNNGNVEIIDTVEGFCLKLEFPIRKNEANV